MLKMSCGSNGFNGLELEVEQLENNINFEGGGMNNSGIIMDMLSTA